MNRVIKKYRKQFEDKKEKKYSEEKFRAARKKKNGKEIVEKLERELKELEQSYYPTQRERVKLWSDLKNMSLDDYYNNLPREMKMNLIRQRIEQDNLSVSDSTEAQTMLSLSDAEEDDLRLDEEDINLLRNNSNEINILDIRHESINQMIIDEEEKELDQ